MLVAERYAKITRLVNERGSIRVSELSELCGVTEETIRRDLDRLEQTGKLQRSHGGAMSVKDAQAELPYFEREVMNAAEKKRIAAEAIGQIEPYSKIALDASTTAYYMAAALPNIPLTVLTNSIKVALELAGKEKIQVFSTGGILSTRSLSYQGPLAESNLEHYHVNKAFISGKGVHPERGISESSELQAAIKRKMIGLADEVYLLADHSKFGVRAFSHIASCEQVNHLITDDRTDPEMLALLKQRGIHVTISK
ncbi:DeoR/GlpR family DNA-binding transcription regulator [Paenibacillus nasutitermitis]|uniref:HTH-type transcriptional regulator YulB n=1 Tax=Paenibacillus nasutitermitis TaxID=1652958 RepID=A0A916YX52_9BACL|nr:DeoR/GlpR family DNA-binding transcription regulator [Paenibacillus nasutitermitis]GGD65412.1 putative HTH-type transcriptional regulator YulB [Paenibacillus nasutitermitis]